MAASTERNAGAMPFAADFNTAVETGWQDDPAAGGGGGSGAAKGGRDGRSTGASRDEGKACGVVVGVIKRGWRPYVCVLDPESALGGQYLVEPLEQKIPKINITTRQPDLLTGTPDPHPNPNPTPMPNRTLCPFSVALSPTLTLALTQASCCSLRSKART